MVDKEKEVKPKFYTELFNKCSPNSVGTKEFEECCEDETSKKMKNSIEGIKNDIRQNSREIIHKFTHNNDKDDKRIIKQEQ